MPRQSRHNSFVCFGTKKALPCSSISQSEMISIVPQFTIISGGALGIELEAEKLARHHCLRVEVVIPPCHSRSKTVPPLTSAELAEAIPTTKWLLASTNNCETPLVWSIFIEIIMW